MILGYLKHPLRRFITFYLMPILIALPHNLSAMFDGALSNYKRKIMIQSMLFILFIELLLRWVRR